MELADLASIALAVLLEDELDALEEPLVALEESHYLWVGAIALGSRAGPE